MRLLSKHWFHGAVPTLLVAISGCAVYPQNGDEFIAYVDSGSMLAKTLASKEKITVDQPYSVVVSAARKLATDCFTWQADSINRGMNIMVIWEDGARATAKVSDVSSDRSQLTVQFIDDDTSPMGNMPEEGAYMFVSNIEAVQGGTELNLAYTKTWSQYRDILVEAASGKAAECTVKS